METKLIKHRIKLSDKDKARIAKLIGLPQPPSKWCATLERGKKLGRNKPALPILLTIEAVAGTLTTTFIWGRDHEGKEHVSLTDKTEVDYLANSASIIYEEVLSEDNAGLKTSTTLQIDSGADKITTALSMDLILVAGKHAVVHGGWAAFHSSDLGDRLLHTQLPLPTTAAGAVSTDIEVGANPSLALGIFNNGHHKVPTDEMPRWVQHAETIASIALTAYHAAQKG